MTMNLNGDLVLVGAGKMGGALLIGLLESGLDPARVIVQDPNPPADIKNALAKFAVTAQAEPAAHGKPAAVVILAVKPQMISGVLPAVAKKFIGDNTLVISVAAGITLSQMHEQAGERAALVRAMPNTPASIGEGMTVCCPCQHVTPDQKALCTRLLQTVGAVAWIDDEQDMDAVTAVSGSGPAYVFHMVESLARAGVDAGLDPALSEQLARQTVLGAGALLKAAPESATTLRQNVTSPNGTTAAALEVLMHNENGLTSLLKEAVTAATHRSRDLAKR